jgi:hypothetical protein
MPELTGDNVVTTHSYRPYSRNETKDGCTIIIMKVRMQACRLGSNEYRWGREKREKDL